MELTAGQIIEQLQKHDPNTRVRISVIHDLDCKIVNDGVIVGTSVEGRGPKKRILLDCSDDGHGFEKME